VLTKSAIRLRCAYLAWPGIRVGQLPRQLLGGLDPRRACAPETLPGAMASSPPPPPPPPLLFSPVASLPTSPRFSRKADSDDDDDDDDDGFGDDDDDKSRADTASEKASSRGAPSTATRGRSTNGYTSRRDSDASDRDDYDDSDADSFGATSRVMTFNDAASVAGTFAGLPPPPTDDAVVPDGSVPAAVDGADGNRRAHGRRKDPEAHTYG